jgi:hypothetical protein
MLERDLRRGEEVEEGRMRWGSDRRKEAGEEERRERGRDEGRYKGRVVKKIHVLPRVNAQNCFYGGTQLGLQSVVRDTTRDVVTVERLFHGLVGGTDKGEEVH